MDRQNITLSIRKDLLNKVKALAAKSNTSISASLTGLMEDAGAQEEGYSNAR